MAQWNRTKLLTERLAHKGKIIYIDNEPYYKAMFKGEKYELPVIHRDSRILDGVCLGRSPREAFFVASHSHALGELKQEVIKRASDSGFIRRNRILESIYNVVGEGMPYDDERVKYIIEKYGVGDDGLISIGTFIREGAGVCRHHAVTCGALIELLSKDSRLINSDSNPRGRPSADRNSQGDYAHAWARYESFSGQTVILDVAQEFLVF